LRINTLPNTNSSSSQELIDKYMMNFIKRIPITFVKGKGMRLWDENGREYLDFVGGWAVDSLGHCPAVLTQALSHQARTLIQVSNAYYNLPAGQLAELLIQNSCFDKAFFANSGAEANEGAVKLARRWGALKLNGAYEVITTHNSFHGRTLAMVAATGQEKFQKPYLPLPAGFVNVPYNNIQAIKTATTARTCAVMVEPIQGEGGVHLPSVNYLQDLASWCRENGILLIFDEVQTGMGRLGKLFGYQVFAVEPDVITLAKGIAGGVAIGVILAKEKTAVFAPGDHGTTFGGNPLACAAGYAVTKYIIDRNIPGHAEKMGRYLTAQLGQLKAKYPVIKDVRGCGLLIGLEFHRDIAERVMYACLERGLVINHLKADLLRVIPPLIIRPSEIDDGLRILEAAIAEVEKG
jgi:acetylornithine/N-succinyldiaminopimelate aminotransferase